MDVLDLVIIGGGPIGLACGIEAKKANLNYIILEKGCLVNSLFNYPQHMTFFSTSEKLEIGEIPFVSVNPKPKRLEALEYYRRIQQSFELHVNLFEEVTDVTKQEEVFLVHSKKNDYRAKRVVLATGFYDKPNLMNIPGEHLSKVKHYYNDPHYYANQHIVVIGSSNSSVDAALETYRKGAHVTMVIRKEHISPRVKYWVKPDIENRIAEGSIKAYFNSCLSAIESDKVHILTPEGPLTLANDFVLALTGYQPDFDFLKKLKIKLSDDDLLIPEHSESSMETNIPGLYLAGVVCGGMNTHLWFIENSRIHAKQIITHILAKERG
jgi:thioredoxin reductase (NADPH)